MNNEIHSLLNHTSPLLNSYQAAISVVRIIGPRWFSPTDYIS